MTTFRAATVWARLPPPSCSRMIEPACVLRMMLVTIEGTPGRDQSRGSTDQPSGVRPVRAHWARTNGDHAPYGARNRSGTRPVAGWIAYTDRVSCSEPSAGGDP